MSRLQGGLLLVDSLAYQIIFHRIHQCQPTGLNDIGADTDRSPHLTFPVGTDNENAGFGSGTLGAVDDPHFVIFQLHAFDSRINGYQRFAQGAIESVHRAVAFRHSVLFLFVDRQFTVAEQPV